MQGQMRHDMLPDADHDERARQEFVQSLKLHLATKVVQGNRAVYERQVRPAFEREHGRPPADRREVAPLMAAQPYYRLWGALQRASQEMCWNSVLDSIARQRDALIARARPKAEAQDDAKGSLSLDPAVAAPNYLTAVDIHCMPGGYTGERAADDVSAGALYDRGGYVYAMGGWGPDNGAMGRTVVEFIQDRFPDLQPQRILDLGCGIGHGTLPYADAYPEAELQAIDVAAPMLRYGHARAEAMGRAVHFRQADATAAPYPDASFDLVVSHILLHETSAKAIHQVMAESYRLLRPGGLTLHVDLSLYNGMDPFEAFMLDWDTRNNNEPFWTAFREMDATALLTGAGFPAEAILSGRIARSAKAGHVFSEQRDAGGRGFWEVIGATKPAAAP